MSKHNNSHKRLWGVPFFPCSTVVRRMLLERGGVCYRAASCAPRLKVAGRTVPLVPRVCRRRLGRIHAASAGSAAATWGEDEEVLGPRCYLIPSDSGDGLDQICITEGKLDIGAGESDYYFTANTVSKEQIKLGMFAKRATSDLETQNGTTVDGKLLEPGSFIDLKDGEEVDFGDGKRYIIRYGDDDGKSAAGKRWLVERESRESAGAVKLTKGEQGTKTSRTGGLAFEYAHKAVALGTLYAINKGLYRACAAASIKFPSPLIGMFIIIGVLLVLQEVSKTTAERVQAFFNPALNWIQRWLPLFYVPTLVVLPVAVQGIQGSDLAKITAIIGVGMPASLLVTAWVAVAIRNAVRTEMEEQPVPKRLPAFNKFHYAGWGAVLGGSLAGAVVSPGSWAPQLAVPYMTAATVMGYLIGVALPEALQRIAHPLITCAVIGNLAAGAWGAATGAGYFPTLQAYITKGAGTMGAGDLLMSFLGVVILSFGFKIFGQRRLMQRHAPEIFGSTVLSAAFSLFATAFAGKTIGLAPELARALVPRSITVALALPIAAQLGAPAPIVAAGVCLTGLLGANFAQSLLNRFGFADPIARGLATAGSAHGLGTAALARNEPEALPFCALAYALIGIISTVLVALPPVSAALMAITA